MIVRKRDKEPSPDTWLLKELGIAQGSRKDVIAWVEKDIKDIYAAGLRPLPSVATSYMLGTLPDMPAI